MISQTIFIIKKQNPFLDMFKKQRKGNIQLLGYEKIYRINIIL